MRTNASGGPYLDQGLQPGSIHCVHGELQCSEGGEGEKTQEETERGREQRGREGGRAGEPERGRKRWEAHIKVLALDAFAALSTEDAGLEALAVLLEAARLLTVAPLVMAAGRRGCGNAILLCTSASTVIHSMTVPDFEVESVVACIAGLVVNEFENESQLCWR
jgi:hypothetical protein